MDWRASSSGTLVNRLTTSKLTIRSPSFCSFCWFLFYLQTQLSSSQKICLTSEGRQKARLAVLKQALKHWGQGELRDVCVRTQSQQHMNLATTMATFSQIRCPVLSPACVLV